MYAAGIRPEAAFISGLPGFAEKNCRNQGKNSQAGYRPARIFNAECGSFCRKDGRSACEHSF